MSGFSFDFFSEALDETAAAVTLDEPCETASVTGAVVSPPDPPTKPVVTVPLPPLPLPPGLPYRMISVSKEQSLKVVIPKGWKRERTQYCIDGDDSSTSSSDSYESDDSRYDTDLISGVYEGGLKTWEGSIDLARFLSSRKSDGGDRLDQVMKRIRGNMEGTTLLELGCGSGIPSLYCMSVVAPPAAGGNPTKFVAIDFNSEVLTNSTWPNVLLNFTPPHVGSEKALVSDPSLLPTIVTALGGDWNSLIGSGDSQVAKSSCDLVLRNLLHPQGDVRHNEYIVYVPK